LAKILARRRRSGTPAGGMTIMAIHLNFAAKLPEQLGSPLPAGQQALF
jgi:hypothetical protein